MNGPSRYNPSRRSRFRNLEADRQRPVEPAALEPEVAAEDEAEVAPLDGFDQPEVGEPLQHEELDATGNDPVQEAAPAARVEVPSVTNDELPRAFQLRNVYEGPPPKPKALTAIYLSLLAVGLLVAGAVAGYLYGSQRAQAVPVSAPRGAVDKPAAALTLTQQDQDAVDAAFGATKQRRFQDAQEMFAALHDAHPDWPSMAIESARAALYQIDVPATTRILSTLTRDGPVPDATFMGALLHMTQKEYDQANLGFAAAVALDPARPDFYYFWGDCLRSQGKPREAAERFREALLRNQYETSDDLYQLKYWLSRIQADEEDAPDTGPAINAALAIAPRPPYSAVFAAAARELKAGRIKEAAADLARGQELVEPVVFRVIMQDPTFVQESWRPEIVGFYK